MAWKRPENAAPSIPLQLSLSASVLPLFLQLLLPRCCGCCCWPEKRNGRSSGRAGDLMMVGRWSASWKRRSRGKGPKEKEKKTQKREKLSPGREEEKGSRALHVTSPKIGKISTLTPEVFMTSNFYLQKFFNYKLILTHQ